MKQYSFSTDSAFKPICKKMVFLDNLAIQLSLSFKPIKEVKNLDTLYTHLTNFLVELYDDTE